jgi:methylmalonyl-CoA/ethylmalonyl-CoA epimerase
VNKYELTLHHLGLAVREPEKAKAFLLGLGYEAVQSWFDPRQGVNLALCRAEGAPDVEVISPAGAQPGPLEPILRRAGEGIYHCCYVTPNRERSLALMRQDGIKLVPLSPPKPATVPSGYNASFHLVDGFGMIELLERSDP